jgi:signal transduction histidine kinase
MTLALEKSRLYEQVKDYSKNLEEKIADRTEELVRLQEKQSQELFEIAHELQTPLTILKMTCMR